MRGKLSKRYFHRSIEAFRVADWKQADDNSTFLFTFFMKAKHKQNKQQPITSPPSQTELIWRGSKNSPRARVGKQEEFSLPLQRDTWHHSPENHCHSGGGDCDSLLYKDIHASNHGPFQTSN